jgi:predicted RNase H-like nuclease (RuvC/YqgF family)
VATKKEIQTMSDIQLEPVTPTVGFVKRAGDTSGQTADYDAYMRDIAETQARTAAFEAKRQQNKPQEPKVELSAIDAALIALEEAAQDFEGPNGYGKPNQPLIDAKLEVQRLRSELAAAESRLTEIESRGDSVQRLTNALSSAESQLQSLVSKAESEEILRLAHSFYGWQIPWDKVSSEMKRDFKNHASVMAFKTFYVQRSIVNPGQQLSVDALQRQIDTVGQKLAELREYLANSDGKTNAS